MTFRAAFVAAVLAAATASAASPALADDGPSFDCTAAMTAVEHSICQDRALAAADLALSRLHTSRMKALRSRGDSRGVRRLQAAQRAWLKERDACQAYKCIAAAYERRAGELKAD